MSGYWKDNKMGMSGKLRMWFWLWAVSVILVYLSITVLTILVINETNFWYTLLTSIISSVAVWVCCKLYYEMRIST